MKYNRKKDNDITMNRSPYTERGRCEPLGEVPNSGEVLIESIITS
jgi:hypothetical protein